MNQFFHSVIRIIFRITGFIGITFITFSCGSTKKYAYLQGQFDTSKLSQIYIKEPVVQKGDLINIIVYSDNPNATSIFNQPLISASSTSSGGGGGGAGATGNTSPGGGSGSTSGASSIPSPVSPGYLVDDGGNIEFQGLGLLHIEGMTKLQIRQLLDSKLKIFLTNPYYTIRFLNYKFTILGEIAHPGIFNIPGEHISILEALGLAGDMTYYGRRDNIMVIRDNNGKRDFGRMDITKPEIMSSPYFYLQPNDVVIIEPTRKKIVSADEVLSRNVSIGATIVSAIAIVYSIFKK